MKTRKHDKRRNRRLIAFATSAFVVCVAIIFGVVANVTPAPNLLSNSNFTESAQSSSYNGDSSAQDSNPQDQRADGQLQADSSVTNSDNSSAAYTLYNPSIAAYTYTQSADEAEELTQAGWQAVVDNTDTDSAGKINSDNSNSESANINSESDDNASDNNANGKNENGEDGNPFLSYSNASEYYVTFNANGGTLGTSYVKVEYDQPMPQITLPTRTGYTFEGYFDAKTGGTQYYNADGSSAKNWDKTSNAELYAHWSVNTFTVTLDDNGGSGGAGTVDAKFGVAMPSVTTLPIREGYTFTGYYDSKSANATKYYNADGTSAKNWDKGEDATLYAIWSANTYTVTLDNKEATTPGTESVIATFDQPLPRITSPAKTGYTFAGYYDSEEEGATQYYYPNGSSAKDWDKAADITLFAKWTANTYTVTLDNNGATTAGTLSVDATYGQDMPSIFVPTKTGYTFGGYYDSLEESANKYYRADGTSDKTWDKVVNATLYAKWTTGGTTITLNGNGATTEGTASVVAIYGQTMPAIEKLPEKTGHTFEGFFDSKNVQYYNADGSSARDWDKTDATDTLTAKWNVCTYNVVLDPNEGTGGSSVTVPTYEQAMPTIIPPTQDGYDFEGYFDTKEVTTGQVQYYDSDGKSTKQWDKTTDTTLYAHWSALEHKSLKANNVQYWPIFKDSNVPTGYTFYAKTLDSSYTKLTNVTSMATLKKAYDAVSGGTELCYTKSKTATGNLKGVAGTNETFNDAFGSDTAKTKAHNKADTYVGSFADKSAICETLKWYIILEGGGGYRPPYNEPTIKDGGDSNDIGINAIQSAYTIDATTYNGCFLSCVSYVYSTSDSLWAWYVPGTTWYYTGGRDSLKFSVVFSRTFE